MVKKLLKHTPLQIKPPLHASASDWDILGAKWTITTAYYVSPPSSFRVGIDPTNQYVFKLCKNANVLKIPQGRITAWIRGQAAGRLFYLQFRNTCNPGTNNNDNCYVTQFLLGDLTWPLYERQAGAQKRSWSTAKTNWPINTWHHIRFSWWISWGTLIVTLDLEVDGAWVQQGDVITVENALHGDAEYQRVGIGASSSTDGSPKYIDDVAIWEYIP